MKKTVTVFGSSLPKPGEEEYKNAYLLGKLLAEKNFNVCTGGYHGIMDAVSKGAAESGAEAIGVTVDRWGPTPSRYLTKEIKCKTLFERITKLIELGDGYVILQGGTGTLLELAVTWEMMNKKFLQVKPAACSSSMWREIVSVMEKQITREGRETGLIKCFDNINEIAIYLEQKLIHKF